MDKWSTLRFLLPCAWFHERRELNARAGRSTDDCCRATGLRHQIGSRRRSPGPEARPCLAATKVLARETATLDSDNHLLAREGITVFDRGPLFRAVVR